MFPVINSAYWGKLCKAVSAGHVFYVLVLLMSNAICPELELKQWSKVKDFFPPSSYGNVWKSLNWIVCAALA